MRHNQNLDNCHCSQLFLNRGGRILYRQQINQWQTLKSIRQMETFDYKSHCYQQNRLFQRLVGRHLQMPQSISLMLMHIGLQKVFHYRFLWGKKLLLITCRFRQKVRMPISSAHDAISDFVVGYCCIELSHTNLPKRVELLL